MKNPYISISKAFALFFGTIYAIVAVGASIAGQNVDTISSFLGQNFTNDIKLEEASEDVDVDYYKSEYEDVASLKAKGVEYTQKVMEEGAVLLKNGLIKGGQRALPLAENTKISMFSASSAQPVYTGVRETYSKTNGNVVDLKEGLEYAGLQVNEELYQWYKDQWRTYGRKDINPGGSGLYDVYSINDAKWDEIQTSAKTKAEYKTALFVLLRIGGEGTDLPVRSLGEPIPSDDMTNGNSLVLSPSERDVFANIQKEKEKGTFDRFIVLMNGTNQVQCDFVEEFGVDAVIHSGGLGSAGAKAIGDILVGKVNPSGKLSDTFWKNHYLNPVLTNWGPMSYSTSRGDLQRYIGFTYDESGDFYDNYTVYQEGVYMGYRYTETRYEDVVLGKSNVGDYSYNDVVSFPFGYGLSYTNFAYDHYQVEFDEEKRVYTASVEVTNRGDVAGKEAVQLFLQKPYTAYDKEHGVGKPSVELVGFAKTKLLQPGESETVKIEVDQELFASYDAYGHRTYILEQGDYYLTVANGAHEAINSILEAKKKDSAFSVNGQKMVDLQGNVVTGNADLVYKVNDIPEDDLLFYSVSRATGATVSNVFDDVDLKTFAEGKDPNAETFEYFSRENWAAVKYAYDLESKQYLNNYVKLTKSSQIAEGLKIPTIQPDDVAYPTMGSTATSYQLIDLRVDGDGNPRRYDDPMWEDLLNQLTWDEMYNLLVNGFAQTQGLVSISKPFTYDYDSDLGVINSYAAHANGLATKLNDPNKGIMPAVYCDNGTVASTRNIELLEDYGRQWGEDCLWAGYTGLYGAGSNIHRSPYLGRSYGYYSEDGVLSGKCLAAVNRGMEEKGAHMLAKHAVLNEQETNRCGGASWANEQSIREIYLRPFEIAIKEGNLQGVMTSLNKLGTVAAPHHPFMNRCFREEFGMHGYNVTDSYMGYMSIGNCLLAGNDLPLSQDATLRNYENGYGEIAWAMRDACHNILYTVVHSNAMNGYSSNMRMVRYQPVWQYQLQRWETVSLILMIASVSFYVFVEVLRYVEGWKKKEKQEDLDEEIQKGDSR